MTEDDQPAAADSRSSPQIAASLPGARFAVVAPVAIASITGGCCYGFTLAIVAGAEHFISDRFGLTTRQLGLIVSNLDFGAAVGALVAGPLSDRFGRKKLLAATAVLFLLAATLTAAAGSVPALLLGRILGGLAVGAAMIIPLYVAEISPAKTRGLMVSFVQIGIVIGILAAYAVGWWLVDAGTDNWRWMFAAGVLPAAILMVSAAALKESPRWLASRGSIHRALDVLARTDGPQQAARELAEIQSTIQAEQGDWTELFDHRGRMPLFIGLVLTVLSVTVGINAVIIYGPMILMRGAGAEISTALLGGLALGAINFFFTLLAMATVDRWGRRPLLLSGLLGMAGSMVMLAVRFDPAAANGSTVLLIPILAFIAFYAISLGPITWIFLSEIFPTRTRGAGMALCMVVMYLADFVVTFLFPWMTEEFGNSTFTIFAGICGFGAVFVWALVPETKGKSLEQIAASWSRR